MSPKKYSNPSGLLSYQIVAPLPRFETVKLPNITAVLPVYNSFSHYCHFDKRLKAEGRNVYIISSAGMQSSINCSRMGNKHTQGRKIEDR